MDNIERLNSVVYFTFPSAINRDKSLKLTSALLELFLILRKWKFLFKCIHIPRFRYLMISINGISCGCMQNNLILKFAHEKKKRAFWFTSTRIYIEHFNSIEYRCMHHEICLDTHGEVTVLNAFKLFINSVRKLHTGFPLSISLYLSVYW